MPRSSSPGRQRTGLGAAWGMSLLSAASFSTSGSVGTSLLAAGWSPAAAVLARVGIAAIVLAIPAVVALRGRWHVLRRQAGQTTTYGLAAVAGAQLCYFIALQHLAVGVALMLEYSGLLLVVGWMWLRHGQRPRQLTAAGAVAAMVGLALVLGVFGHSHLDIAGVLWALGAAFGLATYFVVAGHGTDELPPVALASSGMAVGAVALALAGLTGIVPLRATFGTVVLAGREVSWLVPVACLSLIAATLAYVSGISAARMLGPRLASFAGLTEVMFAVLFAWLLLGQVPVPVQLAGGALIVAGIAMVRLDELRPAPELPPAAPRSEPELAGQR
ncbi:MAG TPA: EamA family transporter [Streptosporangiaceae bacterium]